MQPLVIFGAGGLGRELWSAIAASPECRARWPVEAFVVDDPPPTATCAGLPIWVRSEVKTRPRYLLAVGSPATRQRLSAELASQGWEAVTWIHETVILDPHAPVGEGTLVFPFCAVGPDSRIGRFVVMNGCSLVAHDSSIGDFSSLLGHVAINGNVRVGTNVVLGSSTVIHPSVSIGDDSVVGIGSVVLRDVPQGVTVFGNPARQIPAGRSATFQ
jgi:acetyltransferase EpsM